MPTSIDWCCGIQRLPLTSARNVRITNLSINSLQDTFMSPRVKSGVKAEGGGVRPAEGMGGLAKGLAVIEAFGARRPTERR